MTGTVLLMVLLALPLAASGACWLLRGAHRLYLITALESVAVLGVGLALLGLLLGGAPPAAFAGWLHLDDLGGLVLLIIVSIGFAVGLYSIGYFHHELEAGAVSERELRRFYALLHLFAFTMLLAAVAGNLGVLWTAIAGTTIASAPLVDFYGSHEPLEAAWKYIVLTTAGSMVGLFGFILLYSGGVAVLGADYDFSFTTLLAAAPRLSGPLMTVSFLLVLVGLGTKAGLAPMHTWLPDAHGQAPSPVCALLSGVELNCAMLGILRVFALAAPSAGTGTLRLAMLVFGGISIAVAVTFLLIQRDYKRLLAYSSVEQMGMITLGVGVGAPLAVFGALFQMLAHGLAKSLLFFSTGNLLLRFRTREMSRVGGIVRTMPATAVLVVAGGFAIAGAPPFGLFPAEVSILAGAFGSRQWVPGGLLALALVVGFLALVGALGRMVFSRGPRAADIAAAEVNLWTLVPAYLLLAAVLVLGVWVPGPLHTLVLGGARVLRP